MSIPRSFTTFSQQEIRQLFKKTTRVVNEAGLTILLAPATLSHGKLLVITPRASGNAPARNRIRRRIKALFYEQKLFEIGFDWVIIIKKERAKTPFDRLEKLMQQAKDRATALAAEQTVPHEA